MELVLNTTQIVIIAIVAFFCLRHFFKVGYNNGVDDVINHLQEEGIIKVVKENENI